MICQRCGKENLDNAEFCVNCGNSLHKVEQPENLGNTYVQKQEVEPSSVFGNTTEEFIKQESVQKQMPQNVVPNNVQVEVKEPLNTSIKKKESLNFVGTVIKFILKPATAIKEDLNEFDNTKTSLIFATVISGIITIINLIKNILAIVYIPAKAAYSYHDAIEAEWVFENLKGLKWGEMIFKSFAFYLGILLAVALVYYLASQIIKKSASFKRLLGITSIAMIPIILCSMLLSVLLAKIYAPLGSIVSVIGVVYAILILLEGVNKELSFKDDDNNKLYVNLACMSVIICLGFYSFMKVFLVVGTEIDLESILSLIG